ncbi:MAG: type II toxin-antitoxin system RelE/ParE family toxin [Fimbriimonadaceae bacterium]|nr:type II toxin-antitoxin system RelE/ParE family toxin [Fimbriimonadaceae bacterium]
MTDDRLVIEPAADGDVAAAVAWYESERPGLGVEFGHELLATYARMLEHPLLYQRLARGLRKAAVQRFPYAVFYALEGEQIVVVGVLHLHRDPQVWQRRRP